MGSRKTKHRLDDLMVVRGLAENCKTAAALVLSGVVEVEGRIVDKPGAPIAEPAAIRLRPSQSPYSSRAGLKLAPILDRFSIDVRDWVCIDLGASTGGFTDCLLQRGARKVYAFDVGRGLLDWKLRQDPRVEVREGVNVRFLEPAMLEERPRLATADLSFISLRAVLPRLKLFAAIRVLALVKPQFEAAREDVGRGGVIRDPDLRSRIIEDFKRFAAEEGFVLLAEAPSPLPGAKGNLEHFLYLKWGEDTNP